MNRRTDVKRTDVTAARTAGLKLSLTVRSQQEADGIRSLLARKDQSLAATAGHAVKFYGKVNELLSEDDELVTRNTQTGEIAHLIFI